MHVVVGEVRLGEVLVGAEHELALVVALFGALPVVRPIDLALVGLGGLRPLLDGGVVVVDGGDHLRRQIRFFERRRDGLFHGHAGEPFEGERAPLDPGGVGRGQPLGEEGVRVAEHLLGLVHQRLVGRVGLVVLEHRELGVVPGADPLVPVTTRELVDPLEAADHQPLEVELGRDPHEQIHVELVVVGHEGLGSGTADERVHRRRLDLEEAPVVEEAPQRAHEHGPRAKDVGDVGVGDQIDVALAVAGLDVLEARLGRRRSIGLGEQAHALGVDAQLAAPGGHRGADTLDEVAEVEVLEGFVSLAHLRFVAVELQLLAALPQADEAHAPHRTKKEDAADHPERLGLDRVGVEAPLFVLGVVESRADVTERRERQLGGEHVVGEGIVPALTDARGLALADVDQLLLGLLSIAAAFVLSLAHSSMALGFGGQLLAAGSSSCDAAFSRKASMNASRSPSSTASGLPFSTSVRTSFTSW